MRETIWISLEVDQTHDYVNRKCQFCDFSYVKFGAESYCNSARLAGLSIDINALDKLIPEFAGKAKELFASDKGTDYFRAFVEEGKLVLLSRQDARVEISLPKQLLGVSDA